MRVTRIIACAGLLASGSACLAQLRIDVIGLEVDSFDITGAPSPFGGVTHSGTVVFTNGAASALQDVSINGASQSITPMALSAFTASIALANGVVSGGDLQITLTNAETFACDFASGVGFVSVAPAGGFVIDNTAVFNGLFNASTFAGVNVSQWFNAQPLNGTSISPFVFNILRGDDGEGAEFSVILVPTPGSGAAMAVGLLAFGSRRRRS